MMVSCSFYCGWYQFEMTTDYHRLQSILILNLIFEGICPRNLINAIAMNCCKTVWHCDTFQRDQDVSERTGKRMSGKLTSCSISYFKIENWISGDFWFLILNFWFLALLILTRCPWSISFAHFCKDSSLKNCYALSNFRKRKFSSLPHMPLYCSPQCTIKTFMGTEAVDGVGGNSEMCLKWGSLRNLNKNYLKGGVGKGRNCSWGGGSLEGVTTPAPLSRKF